MKSGPRVPGEAGTDSAARRLATRERYLARFWKAFLAAPASPGNAFPQADRWLSMALKSERALGSTDRRWYADAFFALVRQAPTVALASEARSMGAPAEHAGWIELSLALSRDAKRMKAALARVEPAEFSALVARNPLFGSLEGRLWDVGVPLWLAPALALRSGRSAWSEAELGAFLDGQSQRPPLWVRLQHPEARAAVQAELHASGFQWSEAKEVPGAWQLDGARGLYTLEAYRAGHLEIQDLASQRIGAALAIEKKQVVWDCCAGGGGKSLQIAALLGGGGAVLASDVRAYKLEEVKERAKRAGLHNVRALAWDGGAVPPMPKEAQVRGGYDRVLVDAPCSAAGTWRRNPDAKLRITPESIAELAQIQVGIMEKVAGTVRPGGMLVYATCSWLVEENEGAVDAFLETHSEFERGEPRMLGWPREDADAMFVAPLRKKP